jgi:hypothetical protein
MPNFSKKNRLWLGCGVGIALLMYHQSTPEWGQKQHVSACFAGLASQQAGGTWCWKGGWEKKGGNRAIQMRRVSACFAGMASWRPLRGPGGSAGCRCGFPVLMPVFYALPQWPEPCYSRRMKKMLAAVLLLMVFASPAFAAGNHHHRHHHHHHHA